MLLNSAAKKIIMGIIIDKRAKKGWNVSFTCFKNKEDPYEQNLIVGIYEKTNQ